MNPNMRCHLAGAFAAQDLGGGAWRLARRHPEPAEVWLRGVDAGAAEVFASQDAGDIVHEPLAQLYEGLPLARTDPKSRRFWRRVFWLVRIPGGRLLLAAVARRTRARH
jgi:hypothetical protein